MQVVIWIPTRFKTPAFRTPKSTGLKAGDKLLGLFKACIAPRHAMLAAKGGSQRPVLS
jgi:hypothetical protein